MLCNTKSPSVRDVKMMQEIIKQFSNLICFPVFQSYGVVDACYLIPATVILGKNGSYTGRGIIFVVWRVTDAASPYDAGLLAAGMVFLV